MSQTTDEHPPADGPGPGPTPPGADRARTAPLDQLRRSRGDRKVAGVAGGLARHLDIDPTIVRVLLVVACLFGGAGFLLYVAAWLLLPDDGGGRAPLSLPASARVALLVGVGVLAGILVLGISWGGIGFPWPLVVVGLLVAAYLAVRDRERPAAAWQPPVAAPDRVAGGTTYQPVGQPVGQPLGQPIGQPTGQPVGQPIGQPVGQPGPPPRGSVRKRPRRGGPLLFGPTLAVLAIALGTLGLFDASGAQMTAPAYPALAVAIVGLALVLAAYVGRGGGLVLLGILATGVLITTTAITTVDGLSDTGRQVSATPTDAAGVRDAYYVPAGRIVLDLSSVRDPRKLLDRSVDVRSRAGELVVVLPRGIPTFVDATVAVAGQLDLPDHSSGGVSPTYAGYYGTRTFREPFMILHLHTAAGHIDVRTSR